MPVTNDAQRSIRKVEQFNATIQRALDQAEDAVISYNANGVSSDLSSVAPDEVVIGSGEQAVDKGRGQTGITLAATILYYLKDMSDPSDDSKTLLGTDPLSPAEMKQALASMAS
jgi:hypothetical protein